MDVDVYINGSLRTDLKVLRIMQSYVQPWSCEMVYAGRHDRYPVKQYSWVIVRRSDTGLALFRGNVMQVSPGGVRDEGIIFIAQGRRFRLENEPVNINGSGVYFWNPRGHQCDSESGEDSPGRDGGKWTAGEIIIDILEHALGIPAAGSDIPGHHSSSGCVTETYLTALDILAYDAASWLALDSVIGEFSVDNTPVAQAIQELVALNGGFYGWYIDPTGVLVLRDLKALPETDIEAGELGHWQDEAGRSYALLDNKLDWSLDGVCTSVKVQGTDRTVEVKPANLDACANAALNGGGELELVNAPWKGYACAFRALAQPYRSWCGRSVGFNGSCADWRNICECGVPAGMMGIVHAPRIYRGTDAGAKTYVDSGTDRWIVNKRTGIIMFFNDISADLDPGEKLWAWYWARVPFTVTAGPEGSAYECLAYERTRKINDPAFKHPTSYPSPGIVDDETAMEILAERMLEQFKDVRIQGQVRCDEVDPATYNLDRRYNVTRLERPTTTTEGPTTTTVACWPDPLDWGRLGLNAVEVIHDFEENLTEITLANTFFMLEGYSELRRRLEMNLFAERELNLSEDIVDCQVQSSSIDPDSMTTVTEWPTTTTTTAEPVTTTTPGNCNGCDPPIPDTLHVTLCGLEGDFTPYEGDHTLIEIDYCLWYLDLGGADVALDYDAGNTRWIVTLNVALGTSCRKRWAKTDVGGCTPQGGTYAELDCLDDTCLDHESCEDSAGATCEVTLAGSTCEEASTTTAWCQSCESLLENCYQARFTACCDEMDWTGLLGGTDCGPQISTYGGMAYAGSFWTPDGRICQWSGDLLWLHERMSTTTECPVSGVSRAGWKVDLFYHPIIGWFLVCEDAYWTKDVDPHDPCDPAGFYSCLGGECGTAEVYGEICCEGYTSTTGAPPTTSTTGAPTTTTTAAPPTTTTTQAPGPEDCSEISPCTGYPNYTWSGTNCISASPGTLWKLGGVCQWQGPDILLWCNSGLNPDQWQIDFDDGDDDCYGRKVFSEFPTGVYTGSGVNVTVA